MLRGLQSRFAAVVVSQSPIDDKFQVITQHPAGAIVCTPQYLGVKHTGRALFIQIFLAPGRTLQQKRALYAKIAKDVSQPRT